jgi:peptide/nickel transport system permease protein
MSAVVSREATPVSVPRPAPARRPKSNAFGRRLLRALRHDWLAALGLVLLVLLVVVAACAPLIAPHDPLDQDVTRKLLPPFWQANGRLDFPLGTDQQGRDVLSRILYGARISLALALSATLISSVIGIALGLIAGYRQGLLSDAILRLADAQMAFPFLVLAIALLAVSGPSITNLVIILSVFGWVQFARLTRGEVLSLRERDFVASARALGASDIRISLRHILPNVVPMVIVIWTFSLAQVILVESALSFLGLGVRPPTPSWGSMLADGRVYLDTAWWLETFPGVAIMLAVLSVNLLGDALREVLDPRMRL